MDVRWVSMQMHLSLMMPNPGHATLPNFRWLLCGQVWRRGSFKDWDFNSRQSLDRFQ